MRRLTQTIGALAMVLAAGAAPAALFDRGRGMVYDDELDITWLSDWNYAKTSGYSGNGEMDWTTAMNWANNLVYGAYDDWRLPTPGDRPFNGFGSARGEIGYMFYKNWGAESGDNFSTGTNEANLALFSNVQSFFYWYGKEYSSEESWVFLLADGDQGPFDRSYELYAVAVRPGDVAPVPEPRTAALVLLALGLTAVARRKKQTEFAASTYQPSVNANSAGEEETS